MTIRDRAKSIAVITLLGCSIAIAQAPVPKDGYVPSEQTAIQIAKAVLEGMQGSQFVSSQKPFHAELQGSVWIVEGRYKPKSFVLGGGGLYMRIDKNTGAILGYYFAR